MTNPSDLSIIIIGGGYVGLARAGIPILVHLITSPLSYALPAHGTATNALSTGP